MLEFRLLALFYYNNMIGIYFVASSQTDAIFVPVNSNLPQMVIFFMMGLYFIVFNKKMRFRAIFRLSNPLLQKMQVF